MPRYRVEGRWQSRGDPEDSGAVGGTLSAESVEEANGTAWLDWDLTYGGDGYDVTITDVRQCCDAETPSGHVCKGYLYEGETCPECERRARLARLTAARAEMRRALGKRR